MQLSTRYFIAFATFATAGFAAFAVIDAIPAYRENIAHASRLQQAEAEIAAARIESYVSAIETQIREVGRLPWHSGVLTLEDERAEFQRLLKINPAIHELRSIGRDGKERLYVSRIPRDEIGTGRDLSGSDAFKRASTRPVSYGRAYFRDGSEPLVSVTIREPDESSDILVAEIDLRFVAELVDQMRIGQAGRAYVVDGTNHLLAHPNLSLVHSNLDLSTFPQVQAARTLTDPDGPRVLSVRGISPGSGQDVLTSAFHIPSLDWIALVEQPADEVMAPVRMTLLRTLVLLSLLLLAGYGASLLIARKLTRPIITLQRSAASIGKGNLAVRVDIQSGDEIESLAAEFNQMAERLGKSYSELEARVEARTRDLAAAGEALRQQSQQVESLNAQLQDRLAELEVRKEEAERANAAKTRFLASASHDLRQPMHTISLLVGILRERMRTAEVSGLVDKVQLSVEAMENLFKSLLDISKLDAGAVKPKVSNVEIDGLLRLIETNYAPQAQEKGLAFRVVGSRAIVRSDPVLVERIIGNLVSNAIRYTNHGRILVGCRRSQTMLRVLVIDTGVGIAADQLDDIFEEFYQVANAERDRSKGLGLGLSIVKRSVELLGHALIVRSQPGKGSTFGIELPLVPGDRRAPPLGLPRDDSRSRLDAAFVVIIDDEYENRDATAALCAQWNCHVLSAASIDEAMAKLSGHLRTPDLIVTDYRLSNQQTGLEAIARIREYAEEEIPAIIVTGDVSVADIEPLATPGFVVLHKPVNPDQLRAAMERSLVA